MAYVSGGEGVVWIYMYGGVFLGRPEESQKE